MSTSSKTADAPCVIPGCPNPGVNRSNQYRQIPTTCDSCQLTESQSWHKPRPCHYCRRRRQCELDLTGHLRCRQCHSGQMQAANDLRRRSHSHSVDYARIEFDPDGTPVRIQATTHCGWTHPATLKMLDGRAVYILQLTPPQALHYDPAAADCDRCHFNSSHQVRTRTLREERNRAAASDTG